jgi:hypothetical protein
MWAARDVEKLFPILEEISIASTSSGMAAIFRRYFHFLMVWRQIAYFMVDRWIAPAVQRLFSAGLRVVKEELWDLAVNI